MTLLLSVAQPADAPRIAEIHMAAFGSNAMLRAQFPTPTVRSELQRTIEKKALADIEDPKTTVLVVKDSGQTSISSREQNAAFEMGQHSYYREDEKRSNGKIISFAKWSHPVGDDEDYVEPPWIWPEGTNWEVLDGWNRKMEEVQERLLGQRPCFQLSFIGTDPLYEKRGAASLMIKWGIEQCQKEKVPAYVESTLEAASFYKKNGFVALETFSLNIKGLVGANSDDEYAEVSLLFTPCTSDGEGKGKLLEQEFVMSSPKSAVRNSSRN